MLQKAAQGLLPTGSLSNSPTLHKPHREIGLPTVGLPLPKHSDVHVVRTYIYSGNQQSHQSMHAIPCQNIMLTEEKENRLGSGRRKAPVGSIHSSVT